LNLRGAVLEPGTGIFCGVSVTSADMLLSGVGETWESEDSEVGVDVKDADSLEEMLEKPSYFW
jgi:hypothetical protein